MNPEAMRIQQQIERLQARLQQVQAGGGAAAPQQIGMIGGQQPMLQQAAVGNQNAQMMNERSIGAPAQPAQQQAAVAQAAAPAPTAQQAAQQAAYDASGAQRYQQQQAAVAGPGSPMMGQYAEKASMGGGSLDSMAGVQQGQQMAANMNSRMTADMANNAVAPVAPAQVAPAAAAPMPVAAPAAQAEYKPNEDAMAPVQPPPVAGFMNKAAGLMGQRRRGIGMIGGAQPQQQANQQQGRAASIMGAARGMFR